MKLSTLLFIAAFYFTCAIMPLHQAGFETSINVVCLLSILLIGIPHGAIDNLLYMHKNKVSAPFFYSFYFGIMLANLAVWWFYPTLAYFLFLLVSSYHFGQSQFNKLYSEHKVVAYLSYFSWGTAIITAMVYFNFSELNQLIKVETDFSIFGVFYHLESIQLILLSTSLIYVVTTIYFRLFKQKKIDIFILEIFQIALIFTSFYLFNFIVGFTIFFVLMHATDVMGHEYQFLIQHKVIKNYRHFILKLMPYTILSFFGIFFFYGISQAGYMDSSFAYCMLVLTSTITLPHSLVMNNFYHQS
jgi:Brp/Blh family beta-carotene 15,15'-monooxygenase